MSNQSDADSTEDPQLPEELKAFFENEYKVRPGDKLVQFCEPEDLEAGREQLRQIYAAAGIPTQELKFRLPRAVMGPNGPEIEFIEVIAIGPASACPQKPI